MTTITADVTLTGPEELAERRRMARLIGTSSAAFTALIAIVAVVLALVS